MRTVRIMTKRINAKNKVFNKKQSPQNTIAGNISRLIARNMGATTIFRRLSS